MNVGNHGLDTFFPFDPVLNSHCTDIYRIHHGPANQTVPVKYVTLSKSALLTSQPIKEARFRLAGPNVYARCLSTTAAD